MKQFLPTRVSALLLLALSLFYQKDYSQAPTLEFAKVLQSEHDQGVWSRSTVTDANGNFYMTGLFHGTVDFDTSSTANFLLTYQGGTPNDGDGESDVYIAKYSPNGELIWAQKLLEPTFGGMNEERGSSMILDSNNNLFLTGFTNTRGFFVSKWSSDGDEIWTKYFDDTEDNALTSFQVRKKGNSILISGVFADIMDFDPSSSGAATLVASANDGFLLSLSEAGDFEWVKKIRTNGGVIITGLEVDADNNIFLSGIFLGSVDLDPSDIASAIITSQSVSGSAISSAFLAKYDSNGQLLWNRHFQGNSTTDFFMTFIKKDNANNIIVSGTFKGNTTFLGSATSLNTGDFYTSFLAKYTNDGTLLWAKLFGAPTATQTTFFPSSFCANVLTDSCNNIYVSGEFQGNCDFNPSPTAENVESSLTNLVSGFAAAYSSDGNYLWSFPVAGLGNVTFVEFNGYLPIALDNNNDLIFTGTFRQQLDFDPSAGSSVLTSNVANPNIAGVFIAKYDNPIDNCLLANADFDQKGFRIYPNPSSGLVTIETKEFAECAMKVYDISGKLLVSGIITSELSTFDLSGLSKGVYIIELNKGTQSMHQKLILK
ncbi:T9SS type A sorting domain-containing protein [Flavobacterium wongokense]|uniref:T9SS type A sorting domain-containing protein n=1 Tax=Flavobacterium wongokense TaxID=2910674 RepID=UPI001F3F5080|nr:T9SS type A sorting domain-containing protein [Flavobacterium sp. WG47]MCF6132331.1 T9SS type A sorting domain-containing protein [Flavobacterium sp. WG47]